MFSHIVCNSFLYFGESSLKLGKRFVRSSSCLFKQRKFVMPPSNNLYIRYVKDSDTFQALFHCKFDSLNVEREFNFNRKIAEPVDDFIRRIKANLDKVLTKKSKRLNKKRPETVQIESPSIEISVNVGNSCFPTTKTCRELFLDNDGSAIQFSIVGNTYNVVLNSPWVDLLSLPSCMMASFPVYPNKFEVVFSNRSDCRFVWFSSKDAKASSWEEVGNGFIYIPCEKDVDKYLKVVCVPSNGVINGPEKECCSSCIVGPGPGVCPFEERFPYTSRKLDDSSVRVITYNLLADAYAETETAKTELFSYCEPHAMNLDYRKQLYLKEMLGYNADIICLQEVDEKVFNYDLQHVLGSHPMKGIFCDKAGATREGEAMFFDTNKFSLLDTHRIILAEEVKSNPIFKTLWETVQPNLAAAENLLERPTALQVSVLQRTADTRDKLIVANTHLYFHPDADQVRLLQTGFSMEFIKHLIEQMLKKNPKDRHSLIFCGDFNSSPDCGPYLFMTSNHVPSNHKDWSSNQKELVKGVELNQPFSIESAYGAPKYTNFTQGFADCLDYIYFQTNYLHLNQVVPLPTDEVLRRHTAMPSVVFPSDHLALVADFSWK